MEVIDAHIVSKIEDQIRFIDYVIGVFPGFTTRNAVKKGIKKKRFVLNDTPATSGIWVRQGDKIQLLESTEKPKAYRLDIDVLFEDVYLAIVFKPAGLVVSGNQFKTLENCLIDQVIPSGEDGLDWALPVHRLDAQTSGLVIFAKSRTARRILGEMLEEKRITKEYHAVVHGEMSSGVINSPVEGKDSISKVEHLRTVPSLRGGQMALVKLFPKTGRTHQLRIHCASVGCPIVGDKLHGDENDTITHKGLFLSATALRFQHPITKEDVSIEVDIPEKFESLLNRENKRWERVNESS